MASVSADTLRHYERIGLLAPPRRTGSNYREYPPEALERVKLIRNALAMGFSLKEIASIVRVRDQGGAPCHEVRKLAEDKVAAIERQIAELTGYHEHLVTILADWDERLRRSGRSERARLLEALAQPPPRPAFPITEQVARRRGA